MYAVQPDMAYLERITPSTITFPQNIKNAGYGENIQCGHKGQSLNKYPGKPRSEFASSVLTLKETLCFFLIGPLEYNSFFTQDQFSMLCFYLQCRRLDSIPGWGRSPGEGNGYPLQYSCWENSMDRGAQQAVVHGVARSQTQLSD